MWVRIFFLRVRYLIIDNIYTGKIMKKFHVILVGFLLLAIAGCKDQGGFRVTSTGGQSEIFVVSDREKWDGPVGDTLRKIFRQPYPVINQYEPMFDIYYTPNYTNIVAKHRNLITIATGTEYTEPAMTAAYDLNAHPQLIVSITGADNATILRYMSDHRYELLTIFELAERNRMIDQWSRIHERALEQKIREKFHIEMSVPAGNTLRAEGEDFMWISFELPLASQGFFIYSYPYTGKQDFTVGALTARRNEFAARIPGPSEGFYMITVPEYEPDLRHVRIEGRYWAEMRGFWDVENNFMGGPFISYSSVDIANRRVVTIDCYVFSPKNPKRNLMRQLENLVYTVKFPGDESPGAAN